MKEVYLSYLYLALAMTIVGSTVVEGKLISNTFPLHLSTFLSLFLTSLLFLPKIVETIKANKLPKNDCLRFELVNFHIFSWILIG